MDYYYARPTLVSEMCNALLGDDMFARIEGEAVANIKSGLFLSAIRRIGKSAFLQTELSPAIRSKGVAIVYVDLWAAQTTSPETLLLRAIKGEIEAEASWFSKAKDSVKGVSKVSVPTIFSVDFTKDKTEITLSEILKQWGAARAKSGKDERIVIVIDEAQHALTSDDGNSLMFSLKAARDALNLGAGRAKLLLVFTGSHRSKLNSLVSSKTAPFFGCHVQEFPALDRSFAQAITAELNSKLDSANLLDSARVWDAFCLLDKRPEELQQALKTVLFATEKDAEGKPKRLNDLVFKAAEARRGVLFKELLATFNSLTPAQTAVLVEIFKTKERFSPYSEQALANYKESSGLKSFAPSTAQGALAALVEQGIIWKPIRGGYQIDDPSWEPFWEWYCSSNSKS
jgi:hypothetical protein